LFIKLFIEKEKKVKRFVDLISKQEIKFLYILKPMEILLIKTEL